MKKEKRNKTTNRSPDIKKLQWQFFTHQITKSQYIEGYMKAKHISKINPRRQPNRVRSEKRAFDEAEKLEKKYGALWKDL